MVLGMVNYLGRFMPDVATLSTPLRDLCKSDVPNNWGPEHNAAFSALKKTISSSEVLRYCDNTNPLKIQVDASQRGLGAALLQDSDPIAFASKSLTETEGRYTNIEREIFGIVFGLERFHQYVYGRHIDVHTDHKPLKAISGKHLVNASPKLARILLQIRQYDTTIKYMPGRDIPLADALSRVNPCNTGHI